MENSSIKGVKIVIDIRVMSTVESPTSSGFKFCWAKRVRGMLTNAPERRKNINSLMLGLCNRIMMLDFSSLPNPLQIVS